MLSLLWTLTLFCLLWGVLSSPQEMCGHYAASPYGAKPRWNSTLFWPYTYNGKTVVGYDANGTVIYKGSNNAEICPTEHKKACCTCPDDHCDDKHHIPNCTAGYRPCRESYFCEPVHPTYDNIPVGVRGAQKLKLPQTIDPMSRRNILQRAVGWIAHSFPYAYDTQGLGACNFETCGEEDTNNGCPMIQYEAVCNGLVAMAWRVPNETPDDATSYCIDCRKLKIGDGIHFEHHWLMFLEWVDFKELKIRAWQMGGGWGKTNQATVVLKQLHYCRRRKLIINETESDQGPCKGIGEAALSLRTLR